jgi:hypothetical protein
MPNFKMRISHHGVPSAEHVVPQLALPALSLARGYDASNTSFCRGHGTGWRWEVRFGGGKNKSGVTPLGRAVAIKMAEQEIDRIVKDKEELPPK